MTDAFPIYGMIQNVSEGRSPGAWDANYLGTRQALGSRLFMVDDSTTEVFLGKSPVIGGGAVDATDADKASKEDAVGSYAKLLRPALLVRRQASGSEPLQSLFVGLIEPVHGASAIAGFERLPLTLENRDAVALRIRFLDGRTDVVLVNMDNAAVSGCPGKASGLATRDGKFSLEGRVGVAVQPNHGAAHRVMIAAQRFEYDRSALTQPLGTLTGKLLAVKSRLAGGLANVLVTDAVLPVGTSLRGRWLSLRYGTYEAASGAEQTGISEMFQIESSEKREGKTWIRLTEDPALAMTPGKVTELLRPRRTFEGVVTFEIALRTSSDSPAK